MNTELLLLASFNDIFALFVGLNIAYLLVNQVNRKEQTFSLFSFLNNARRRMSIRILLKYENKINEIRSNITSIDLFTESIRVMFSDYIIRQKEISTKLENLKQEIENVHFTEEKCIKTKYMPYLAFDCALYGIFLIILSAFEHDFGIEIHYYISLLNTVIVFLSFYCFIYEDIDFEDIQIGDKNTIKKRVCLFLEKLHPSIWKTLFLAILIILLGIIFKRSFLFLSSTFWLNTTYFLAVVLSIGSVILYLLICSLNNYREFRSCTREIKITCKPNKQDKPILKAIRKIKIDKERLVKSLSDKSFTVEEKS